VVAGSSVVVLRAESGRAPAEGARAQMSVSAQIALSAAFPICL
jgi:hypothetical protein